MVLTLSPCLGHMCLGCELEQLKKQKKNFVFLKSQQEKTMNMESSRIASMLSNDKINF